MEQRAKQVYAFIESHRRVIATTLRDTRDDEIVYALIGTASSVDPSDIEVSCLTMEQISHEFDTQKLGVQWCLDQMNSLHANSHRTFDVVVGLAFGDDVLTFITRVAPT